MESSKLDEKQAEFLKFLIEQNWLHARHVENERLWFTNIYFIVVAGILSYLGSSKMSMSDPVFRYLTVFLLIFAILGAVVTAKLSAEFRNHVGKIALIFDEKAVDLKKYMGFPINSGAWKYLKVRRTFLLFYLTTIVLWCVLLVLSFIKNNFLIYI